MSKDYHGPKPVTDEDQKMAKIHLKAKEDLLDKQEDLAEDKIDDHKKALKDRLKEGNKPSATYNKGHIAGHEQELDDIDKEHDKIQTSLKTLANLRTHSRKTYNDVRKAKVNLMYRKSNGQANNS